MCRVHPVRCGESKACLRADHLELADDLPLLPKGEGEPVSGNREFWKLEALVNGRRTHLTYYIYTDPGGALPRVIEAVQPQALVAE